MNSWIERIQHLHTTTQQTFVVHDIFSSLNCRRFWRRFTPQMLRFFFSSTQDCNDPPWYVISTRVKQKNLTDSQEDMYQQRTPYCLWNCTKQQTSASFSLSQMIEPMMVTVSGMQHWEQHNWCNGSVAYLSPGMAYSCYVLFCSSHLLSGFLDSRYLFLC